MEVLKFEEQADGATRETQRESYQRGTDIGCVL